MPLFEVPPLLRRGDKVRVVAPSSPFDRVRFELGLACVERAGLVPVFEPGLYTEQRYLAGDDDRRLGELHTALTDPSAAAIWFARGGYGATRLLPRLDAELVARTPKWLVGFSDATALHCRWQGAGLASLHGPVLTVLDSWGAEARSALWSWLFEGKAPPLTGRLLAGSGVAEGPVMGGNLTVLTAMAGGGFIPDLTGAILLLEDIGERPYRLDRSLTCLFQSGALDGVAGFAIGQLTACEEPPDRGADYDAISVVVDVLSHHAPGVPILAHLPVGHDASSFAVPLGCPARLDGEQGRLEIAPLPRIDR